VKLGSYIVPLPNILNPDKVSGRTFIKWILLRLDVYRDLKKENPDLKNIGILIHEETHLKRIREKGLVKLLWKCLFTRRGHLEEELLAYGEEMRYLKSRGSDFDIEKVAGALSGKFYGRCCSYPEAKARLEKLWVEAK
jgi:hypothetical protein